MLLLFVRVDLLILVRDALLLKRDPCPLNERTELNGVAYYKCEDDPNIGYIPIRSKKRVLEALGVELQSEQPHQSRRGGYHGRTSF